MNIKDTKLSGGCHVVILGAGASIASTIRDPEEHGLKLPSMNNLPDVVGLHGCLSHFPQELIQDMRQRIVILPNMIQIIRICI